jgi:hypothetical protein
MAASSIPMLTMTSPVLPPHPSSLPSNSAVRVSEWVWSQRRFFHHAAVPSLVSLSELRTSFMDQKALDHSAPLLRLLRYDTIFHVEFHKTACVILNNVMRIYFPAALEHFDSAVDRYGIGVYHSDKDTDWYWISWQEKLVALWLVMLMHGTSGQPLFFQPRARPASGSEDDMQHRVPSLLLVVLKTAVAKTTAGSSIMSNSHFWSADAPGALSSFWGSALNTHELVDWLDWRDKETDYLPNLVTTWYDHHRNLTITNTDAAETRRRRKIVLFLLCSSHLLDRVSLGFQRLLLHNYTGFGSLRSLSEVVAAAGILDDSLVASWFYLKEKIMTALLDPTVYHPVKEEYQLRSDTLTLGRHRFAWKKVIRPVLPFIGIQPASAWIDRAPHFLAPYFGFRGFDSPVIESMLRDLHEVVILTELRNLRDTGLAFSYYLSEKHGPCALDIYKHWTLGMQTVDSNYLRTYDLQTEETLIVMPTAAVYRTQLLSLAAYIHQQETRHPRDVMPLTPPVFSASVFEWTVAIFGAFQWKGQTSGDYAETCLVELMILLRALLTGETDVKREARAQLMQHAKRCLLPAFRYYADRLHRPAQEAAVMEKLFGSPSHILFNLLVIGFLPYRMDADSLRCFHTQEGRKTTLEWIQQTQGRIFPERRSSPYSRLIDSGNTRPLFWFDNKLHPSTTPPGSTVPADKALYSRGRLDNVFLDMAKCSTIGQAAGIDWYIDAQLGLIQPYFHYSQTRLGTTNPGILPIPHSLLQRWLPSLTTAGVYSVPVDTETIYHLPAQNGTKMVSAFGANHLVSNDDLLAVRHGMEYLFGVGSQHGKLEQRLSFADTRLPLLPLAGRAAWDAFILPHHPSPKQLLSPRLISLIEGASKVDIPCPLLDHMLDSATQEQYDAMNDLFPLRPGRGGSQKRTVPLDSFAQPAPKKAVPPPQPVHELPVINFFSEERPEVIYSPSSPSYEPGEN